MPSVANRISTGILEARRSPRAALKSSDSTMAERRAEQHQHLDEDGEGVGDEQAAEGRRRSRRRRARSAGGDQQRADRQPGDEAARVASPRKHADHQQRHGRQPPRTDLGQRRGSQCHERPHRSQRARGARARRGQRRPGSRAISCVDRRRRRRRGRSADRCPSTAPATISGAKTAISRGAQVEHRLAGRRASARRRSRGDRARACRRRPG